MADERWTITIQAVPNHIPAIARLKRLLKVMLRSFGFRVVTIQEDQEPANGDNGGEWTANIVGDGLTVKDGIDEAAVFIISMKAENFVKMMNGELNGQMAFMSGKLKFKGSMGKAMKLSGLLF